MARAFFCRLTSKREAMVRDNPALVSELRRAIRAGDIEGGLDLGIISGARREKLEGFLAKRGPRAKESVGALLDGELGEWLHRHARILTHETLTTLAATMTTPKTAPARAGSIEALAQALRDLIQEAHRAGQSVLLIGTSLSDRRATRTKELATKKKRGKVRATIMREEHSRHLAEREMTALDARILDGCLKRSNCGLRHPNADERLSSYWDLRDVLFDASSGGVVRRLVALELRQLFLLWASAGVPMPSRRLAALVLAQVAEAIGRGALAADLVHERLVADVLELGPVLFEILDEMDAPAKVAIALLCARASFAEDMVLARLRKPERAIVRAAYAGALASYRDALETIETAILETA